MIWGAKLRSAVLFLLAIELAEATAQPTIG